MSENGKSVRIAAVGDLHVHESPRGAYRQFFTDISKKADVVALCGDLTNYGTVGEAESLASDLDACTVPVVGVLGNHDHHGGHDDEIRRILRGAKMALLDEDTFRYEHVGFAGVKGFGGGFNKHMLTSFGEEGIKHFVNEAVNESLRLENALRTLETPKVVVVLHYSPVAHTLEGEALEIYPFLGSSRLAETIDLFDVDVVFHGHAHHGTYEGRTHKGVPVFNCCLELMRKRDAEQPFALVEL